MRLNETTETEESDAFFEVKHENTNPAKNLNYVHVQKFIINVTMRLSKSNHHQQVIPQQNTQNTAS